MPVELRISEDGRRVDLQCHGVLKGSDLLEANRAIYESPQLLRLRTKFVDFSSIRSFLVTPVEIRRLARQDVTASQSNPHMKVAIVAVADLVFGTARMWEAYVSEAKLDTRVFRTRAHAEKWLRDGRERLVEGDQPRDV